MRVFQDLSVGAKLAVGSALAILMLVALVLVVRMEADMVSGQQSSQANAARAQLLATEAALQVSRANAAQRGVLLAQDAGAIQAEQQVIQVAMREARRAAGEARRLAQAADARAALDGLVGDIEIMDGLNQEMVTKRGELLQLRDERLLPRLPEFDQALESVAANLAFGLTGEALENAREVLNTYSFVVN